MLARTNEILGGENAEVLSSVTIAPDLSAVAKTIGKINGKINSAEIPYAPQEPNSNSYTFTTFQV